MEQNYLESVRKQFEYYKLLGERTFDQLEDAQLFWQHNEQSNSIDIIVNHLSGNMKSRWTDFMTTDGEKPWRQRDREFEQVFDSRDEMMEAWESGWERLFEALDSVNTQNFDTTVYIRNQGHTIVEAINRQLAHYAYHVGQMVYVGRMMKGANWKSLSIPKGDSAAYNKEKFSKDKHKAHFTDEFLNDDKAT
ncbi:MAG: DUF1572 family protein [Bacteroidota bacterium]